MKKKTTKITRTFAILMAVIMCFTMTSAPAFAEDNEGAPEAEKTILVFGDSMSSGYGLKDFVEYNQFFDIKNNDLGYKDAGGIDIGGDWTYERAASLERARISKESYPWKMKKYIADEEFGGDLNKVYLSSMCLSGMRTDELRALLDEKYCMAVCQKEDQRTRGEFTGSEWDDIGFLTDHIRNYTTGLGGGGAEVDGVPVWQDGQSVLPGGDAYKRVVAYTRGEVAKADVIITDVCLNNFGTYLGERFSGYMGIKGYEYKKNYRNLTIDDIDGVSDRTWSAMKVLKNELNEMGYIPGDETMDEFVSALIYGFADCITNISAIIEQFKEINPNAKIIVVGIYNTAEGFKLTLGGQEIDVGSLTGMIYDAVNTYIRVLDKNSPNIYYAEPSGGLKILVDDMAAAESYEEVDETLMNQMMEGFYGMFGADYEITDEMTSKLKTLLVDAAHETNVNMDELIDIFAGMGQEGNPLTEDIGAYLADETGSYQVRESTLAALHLAERFLFNHGLGTHPSVAGCEQKFQDIKAAYEKEYTAFEEVFAKYYPYILGMGLKIKEAYDNGDIDRLAELAGKIDEIEGALGMLDQAKMSMEQLQKFMEIKDELTARTEMLLDCFGLTMEDVAKALDEATTPEKIAEYIAAYEKISEAVAAIDAEELNADTVKELLQLKHDLQTRIDSALDHLGLSMDDVYKAFEENTTPEKIAEYIEILGAVSDTLDMIDSEGLTVDQLKALIAAKNDLAARLDGALDMAGLTMDDLIRLIDENTTPEKLAEYAAQIERLKEAFDQLPKSEAGVKAELMKQLDNVTAFLEDKASLISDDLAAQIRELSEMLKYAVDQNDYSAIIDKLMPIGEQLLVLGEAAGGLPAYEAALDRYVETSKEAMAGLEDRVTALEMQMGRITAKALKADLTAKTTFPKKSVSVKLTWALDEDADGYILTKNGREVDFAETKTGFVFTDPNVKIGRTYTYEVTPYIFWGEESEMIYGKTFKRVVKPKVKLTRGTLRSVKKGKRSFTARWKKVTGAAGYQIWYKTGKKVKKVNVVGTKKLSKKIKRLKARKIYTVKVRAWKKVDGKKYYGAWSKAKKIKTR